MKLMKTSMLSTVIAGALLTAVTLSAQDAPRSPRSSAPNDLPQQRAAETPASPPAATNTPTAPAAPQPQPEQAPQPGNQVPQPADQPPPAPASATNAPTNVTLPNGEKGLIMNFRGVSLENVLDYMSDAAGLVINPDNRVDLGGKVNLWSAKPVSKEEAINELQKMLEDNGYTAIQNGRMLTIMRADEAGRSGKIPVFKGNEPDRIPQTPMIVTEIIPVRTLNVVQLVKNLQQLLPSDAKISADESANSVILTDTQANIHRMVEIIAALDSVTSGNATMKVFPLKFADSKSIAQLIKDLFPSADTQGQGSPFGSRYGRFSRMMGSMMGGGGFPGAPGGDNGGENNGHTPTAKVNAVSDDHANAVVVSAPDELMPTMTELVNDLDKPVDDTTVARIYPLHNADATEMANLITSLFPDDTAQNDASRTPFGGFRFGFGGFPPRTQNNANEASDRMKKMAHVSAVADPRTQKLIVTAGTNLIEQIDLIVKTLDESDARKVKPFYFALQNADPADVLPILQSLFPTMAGMNNTSSSYNSQQNYLALRAQQQLQNQNNQSSSGFGSFGNMGSGGRGF